MEIQWRIALLGELRAEGDNRIVTRFRRQKTGVLLAYMAYYLQRSHLRDMLIDLLWPEGNIQAGRNNLSVAVSGLRHQLEPPGVPTGAVLVADRTSVRLNPASITTDVAEFEVALQSADRAGNRAERIQSLTRAVDLYRGELLVGYYESWILGEREHLAELYFQALAQLTGLLEQAGEVKRALEYARRGVNVDPLREEAHRELMRLLAAAGRPKSAMRHYRELERLLKQELDATPTGATRTLARELAVLAEEQVERSVDTAPATLPTGTVTFLLTDIEVSTALWERTKDAFAVALTSHHALLRRLFRQHGGYEVKELGDGFLAAFAGASDALACAIASQRALVSHPWPPIVKSLRVRMALHTGDVQAEDGDYHSLVLNLASRILLAGHGGQILCSEGTAALLRRSLEAGVQLTDLGVYRLKDVTATERLFQVDYPEMAQRVFPPLRADAGYAGHLPRVLTRFFGREAEIARVRELLLSEAVDAEGNLLGPGSGRLVTLTGPAGTGKTRLALAVAARLQDVFQGAVWFVPLEDLTDARLIADYIRNALRVPPSPDVEPLEQVVTTLARQPSFLLLDNLEHLLPSAASLVETLMKRDRKLTLLVTSRQRLDLPGEREFLVPPLPVPVGWESPARLLDLESVRLFVDRAQAVRPDFQVAPRNARAVAELCGRLEGLPLALELAAARAGVLTPTQMLARLEQRFELLARRQGQGQARHRSLRAALDWSHHLLSAELQQFFARLSVFRGGWTLESAEQVCEAPEALEFLEQLRECSLLIAEEGSDEIRFRMLETLRAYAREQLGVEEFVALGHRHAEYYLAMAEEAEPRLARADQGKWLERLEGEHDNLRAALGWFVERGQVEEGLRLSGALAGFWSVRGHWAEGLHRLAELLALPAAAAHTSARAKALDGAGGLAEKLGDREGARLLLEESLSLRRELGDRWGIARSLHGLASMARSEGKHEAACILGEESLMIRRQIGDPWGIAASLCNLGIVVRYRGDSVAARALYEESLGIFRKLGDQRSVGDALQTLGHIATDLGDYTGGRALHEESLAIFRELGDQASVATALEALGHLAYRQGDNDTARCLLEEGRAICRELGYQVSHAIMLIALGNVVEVQGDHEAAQELYEQSLGIFRELGEKRGIAWSLENLGAVALDKSDALAARTLHMESLAIRRELGEQPNIASSLYNLGMVAFFEKDYGAARAFYKESLAIQRNTSHKRDIAECLEGLAAVDNASGKAERAVRLFGVAAVLRERIGVPLPPLSRALQDRHMASLRAALDAQAFAAAWRQGRAMTLEQAMCAALAEN
jgi:predicted ATPase/DNA-binding SARP family transcriptional activator